MPLASYRPVRRTVTVDGEALMHVRGLALSDIAQLLDSHFGAINELWAKYNKGTGPENVDWAALMADVATGHNGIAAEVICLAADEYSPEALEAAKLLPLGVQLDTLSVVIELTFKDIGGPLALARIVERHAAKAPSIPSSLN